MAAAKKAAAGQLGERTKTEIEDAFAIFDPENTGSIAAKDLKMVMRALGFEPRKDDVRRVLSSIGQNETGRLTKQQVIDAVAPKMQEKDSRAEILRAFSLFLNGGQKSGSASGNGRITLADLRRVADELGEPIGDDELKEMIEIADKSGTGAVNQEDFVAIMKKTYLY